MLEDNLQKLTNELIQLNQEAHNIYKHARETNQKGDFYTEVKPFADLVKSKGDEWESEALKWLSNQKQKNLHPIQIKNTNENIQMVSIQAFFPETSLKRFKSHVQSIEYVLKQVYNSVQ
ncbi:YppE family protein [Falsibacillus albus]|uniref:DUF1798 family protein n=1 Tax=Falsibacillus albus TaxID=2478915 RepID=A0A3L7JYF0_9BACI|nr:YppE family protein [Falsibacillus albus]RLQ95139.1 DUF1798 family protein [Falsibacillus albus]